MGPTFVRPALLIHPPKSQDAKSSPSTVPVVPAGERAAPPDSVERRAPGNLIAAPPSPHGAAPSAPAKRSTVEIEPLALTKRQTTWKYIGPTRRVSANIGSPQHVRELVDKIPQTAKALFVSWAEPAAVFREVAYHLERQGIRPEDPSFVAAYRAAFQQRVADGRGSSRAASRYGYYQRGAPGVLYGRFVSDVIPHLVAEMNAIDVRRVTELSEKYDIPLARSDDAYKALLGQLVFMPIDDTGGIIDPMGKGLALPAADREALLRDAESLRGYFGRLGSGGGGVFRASFETRIYEARDREVAEAFGRALLAAGLKPHEVDLAITPEYR